MACSCQKGRTQYEVWTTDANGVEKRVFTGAVKTTAEAVQKRYPGAELRTVVPAKRA
ncbi:hypothetical protein [Streptomyces chilikensis]|uniref:Uncharacterized protein n=1 Tax=Streptomyces chilikensis TaxID=1194079 RepID=A0ABV3EJ90_9ACTN